MEDKIRSNKPKQNKNRHFKLPPEIIEQYQEMPIFKAISSKKIKPFDVIRLHNLARQLKKQHPNLSSETILQNQIELYLVIQAELKKYFKSDKSDDARKNMDDAIKAKYQELAQNPLINKIYETNFEKYAQKGGNKAWINFTATNLQQIMHNQFNFDETQHWDDFIASADSLTQILESTTKKKEKSSLQSATEPSTETPITEEQVVETAEETMAETAENPAVEAEEPVAESTEKPVIEAEEPVAETSEEPVVETEEEIETTETTIKPKGNIAAKEEELEEPKPQNIPPSAPIVVEETQDDEDTENHTDTNNPEPSQQPSSDGDSYDFTSWSEFSHKVATKLNGQVAEENTQAQKFVAKIEHPQGSVSITATSTNRVSIGAKDPQGKSTVPDLKVFQELAQKALNEDSDINFGNIKTPEFKARLLIACMEKGVKTNGEPKLTDEFLNSIDPTSASRLRILQNKQNTQNQPTPAPTPTPQQPAQTPDPKETSETTPQPVSKSDYEKSRDEREKLLEMHSKTRSLTPQEQHELEYIKFTKEHKQALEEAIARTGDNNDPRTAEHTIATGLKYEDYYYHSDNRTYHGWKLHLDIVPNRKDKTTEAVSDFLKKLNVEHKIYHGGENGKGMTIYVGSYDDTIKLAKEINSRFGKDIATPPIYTDQKASEIDFNEKVAGRFYMSVFGCQYPHSSIKGICPINLLLNSEEQDTSAFLAKLAKQANIVSNDCSRYFHRIKDFHDRYVITNLESYCAHKFYQKHLGEFYCGKNADKFEQQIFGDALPPKGSSDRAAWDNIASQYVKKVEEDCPNCLTPPELKNYKPIDFTQAPAIVRPQQPQRQP